MSDDKVYKDGDVVWVKLGNNWWPGEVTGVHRQPEGLIKHLKRKPYCVVKFFQEDAYEYVKSAKQIFPFQCNKKDEFIKKGNALYNAKNKFMEKFPGDVEIAERLTRKTIESDMLIINNRPDSIVKAILGQSLTPRHSNDYYDSEYASNTSSSNKRRSGDSVTKILNITPQRTIATASATNTTDSSNTPACTPARMSSSNSTNANFYRCNLCDFSSQRQNVMILHRRTHNSGGSTLSAAHTPKTAPVTPATPKATSAVRQLPSASSVPKVHHSSAPTTPSSVSKTTRETTTPLKVRHSLSTCTLDNAASTERNKPAASTRTADTDFACTPLGLPLANTPTALPTNHTGAPWITSAPTSTAIIMAGAKHRKKKDRARTRRTLRSSPHIDADVSDITLPEAVPFADTIDEDISDVSSSKTEITVVSAPTRTQKQSAKHVPLALPVSTPATKRKSEEIRQRLLADWSDEEKDEEGQLVVDESKLADMDVAADEIDDGQNALETNDVKHEMVTPPLVAAATPAIAGNRIRNIPKKDRRDVVLKDFNSDFTLSNSSSSASRTPPLVQIDSTNSNSSSDSVVLVVELPNTEPIDVDAEATGGETEMETEADIKSEDINEKQVVSVVDAAATAAVEHEITEGVVDQVDEVVEAEMEEQIVEPAAAAIVEQMEEQTAEKTINELRAVLVESLDAVVAPEIEEADADKMLAAVDEQPEQQMEMLHSSEAASVQPEANTAAINDSETTATSNKSNESALDTPEVVESPHAGDNEEPEKQQLAMVGAVAASATATVASAAAALSCFDFQEEEDDTESDVLKSIANFKKKYTSPDKAQTQTSNAIGEQQRTIAARSSMDAKNITSPQRLAELEQKDQQLAAEIESLLEQTSAHVVDMSAIAAPSSTANVGGAAATKEEVPVKGLPIKERGKRIFKSRNRSRLDEQPPSAEPTTEVSAKRVSEGAEENAPNGSVVEPAHTELNNGALAELGKTMAIIDEPQLAEPTEKSAEQNAMKDVEQPQELPATNVCSDTFEESTTVCEEPAPPCDEPKNNEQSAEEPEEMLKEQCDLTIVREADDALFLVCGEAETMNVAINADDTNAPAVLEASADLQHSVNELNSTQSPLTDAEQSDNVVQLINEENVEPAIEAQQEENGSNEDIRVALTAEDSLCELKDSVDQQSGAEVISRFTSPTDENSSVGISDAGAEFGSPTSMLDDERLTLLTNNLITPTEGLTDTLTPENAESDEKCATEHELADTAEKCEVETMNNTAVEETKMAEQAADNAEHLLSEEASVEAAADDKLEATTESDVVAAGLAADIEQVLVPEPEPTPIITVTEPELEEDDDEIESPPHEALSGNEFEAEIEKARKLKMIKTRHSSRRKCKEKAPNIVKECAEVEMTKQDAKATRLTRSKRTSTTSNSEMELIAATMELSTLKPQSIRSKRASITSNSESITSNMESPTAKVECISPNVMSTRAKRASTASNSDSIASIVESPTAKDSSYVTPTRSKRASTASNSDSVTSNTERPTTKGECITPNVISTRSKRASSDSVTSNVEHTTRVESESPKTASTRSKRVFTASNSDLPTSNVEHTTRLESESPKTASTRSKRVSTASNTDLPTSNVEHTTRLESESPKTASTRSKRVSNASNSDLPTSNVEHTTRIESESPRPASTRSKRVSTASNSDSVPSNVEHTTTALELATSKIASTRSKRASTASNSDVEHTTTTVELTTPIIASTRSKRLSTASNGESSAHNVEHTTTEETPKTALTRSKRLSPASNSETAAYDVEHTTKESATPKIESKVSKRVLNSDSLTTNLEHAPSKTDSTRSKKGSARSKKKSTSTIAKTSAPADESEPNSEMSPAARNTPNKLNADSEVETPVGRRVTRSSLQNKPSPTAAEFEPRPKEEHTKEANTPWVEEVKRKPQQRRSRTTKRITSSPKEEKMEQVNAESKQDLEDELLEKMATPNAAVDRKDAQMTQPTETIEKIWTTDPLMVEQPIAPYKPAKERKSNKTPAPDPLSLSLEPESKSAARKRRSHTNVTAARRRSIHDAMPLGAETLPADGHYQIESKTRKLETASTIAESQKHSSTTKRPKTATMTKPSKTKVTAGRAIEVTPTTVAPERKNAGLEQLSKSAKHGKEKPERLKVKKKSAVVPDAISAPQMSTTAKEVQQPEVEQKPKAVTSAPVAMEASLNISRTSPAAAATTAATLSTASEMRLFRPRRKTLSVESAAAEVKLDVPAQTTQHGDARGKKSETDLRACNVNGPSEPSRISLMPPKQEKTSAARTPSPIGMRHINVDVAHPLSSQIANIMAIAGATVDQNELKRRKSLEDDIPSFIIERRAQAPESQLVGSAERDALAHVQSLCPQMKITRKEKRVEPEVQQQVPLQCPQQQQPQQQQSQPVCKVAEPGAVFDIDNMPIVLSNEQMLSGMQFVIGAPLANDAAAAACSALAEGPRILQQQIIQPARPSPPPLHQPKLAAPHRPRQSSTNQRDKQIGVDARGNKYVIIKTPPSDLNVQPAMSFQPPNVTGTFKIGAGVTLRPMSEPNSRTESPVVSAPPQQLQLPLPAPAPPPFSKPKSPAAAATGGRKQVGNTITLPSSITAKQQKLNDELSAAAETCASPQLAAAADVGNHGSGSKTSRRPPTTGGARKQPQQQPVKPVTSSAQMSLSQVKVQLQQRQPMQLQPRQVQQRRQTACVEKPPNSTALTLTRRLSCTDTHLVPPAKIPKRSVGNDVATMVEKQLLQLQQQRKFPTAPGTATATTPPPLHHLHNRKPRKTPATAQQSPANAAVAVSAAAHPQDAGRGETNMIVNEPQSLLQQSQLNAAAVAQQQPQVVAGFSIEPPPLVPAYVPTDQTQVAPAAATEPDAMALVPYETPQVAPLDSNSGALVRHRSSIDSNSMAMVPYRTTESMAMVPCQTLVEYDQELEAKVLAVPTVPVSKFSDTFRLCTISEDKFIPINELLFQLEKNQLKQVPREEWQDELPELLVQRARLEEWIFLPQLLALQTDGESETCLALICLPPTSSIAAQLQAAEAMENAAAIEAAAAMEAVAAIEAASEMEVPTDDTEDAAEMEALVAVDGVPEAVGASAFLLHSDGHEMIIDAATFAQLLSNPDEQMEVVTQDGEVIRLTRASLLHGMVQRAQIAGTAAGDEQLQVASVGDVQQLSGDVGGEAGSNDIIAVALAGSELYGSQVLEIDTPQALQLMSSDGSIVFQPPVLPQPHLTPPITAHTSETNAVLNQTPIMSALETPSTAAGKCQPAELAANIAVTSALLAAGASGLPGCRPNLDDSLAVIGLTTQPSAVPSSLELPITVTNPAIAPKVTMATQPVDIVQFHTQCAVSAAIASEPRIYNDPGS